MSFLNSESHHAINPLRIPPVAVATDLQQVIEILHCGAASHLQPLEGKPIDRRHVLQLLRPSCGRSLPSLVVVREGFWCKLEKLALWR